MAATSAMFTQFGEAFMIPSAVAMPIWAMLLAFSPTARLYSACAFFLASSSSRLAVAASASRLRSSASSWVMAPRSARASMLAIWASYCAWLASCCSSILAICPSKSVPTRSVMLPMASWAAPSHFSALAIRLSRAFWSASFTRSIAAISASASALAMSICAVANCLAMFSASAWAMP